MRKSEIPSWYSQLVEQGKVRKMQVYLTNYWTVCREARNFFELQEKRTETQCRGTGYSLYLNEDGTMRWQKWKMLKAAGQDQPRNKAEAKSKGFQKAYDTENCKG